MKRCSKCREVKPRTEFYKDASRKDKKAIRCKACQKAYDKAAREGPRREEILAKKLAWTKANPEKIKKYQKTWRSKHNKETDRAKSRDFYKNNPEYFAAYREANRDKRRAYSKAWREANREKTRAQKKAWDDANPTKGREAQAIRRARMENNGIFHITAKDRARLYASPCVACGATDDITADHIIPIKRGGPDGIGNLQPLCFSCNASKKDALMIEWRAKKAREARKDDVA